MCWAADCLQSLFIQLTNTHKYTCIHISFQERLKYTVCSGWEAEKRKSNWSLHFLCHCTKDQHVLQANCLFYSFAYLKYHSVASCPCATLNIYSHLTQMNQTHPVSCWSQFCLTVSLLSMLHCVPTVQHWLTIAHTEMQKSPQRHKRKLYSTNWQYDHIAEEDTWNVIKTCHKEKVHLFHTP